MNIVLIGYRGTGKSAVADIISARLKWPKVNMDEEIVAEAGMSIPDIVKNHGWDFFRDLESNIVGRVSKKDRTIIDAGGGVIVRSRNVEILRKNGVIIWLKANPETIANRIKRSADRPSLTGNKSFLEEIEEVLRERIPAYKQAADFEVETSPLAVETIAKKILVLLEGKI